MDDVSVLDVTGDWWRRRGRGCLLPEIRGGVFWDFGAQQPFQRRNSRHPAGPRAPRLFRAVIGQLEAGLVGSDIHDPLCCGGLAQ